MTELAALELIIDNTQVNHVKFRYNSTSGWQILKRHIAEYLQEYILCGVGTAGWSHSNYTPTHHGLLHNSGDALDRSTFTVTVIIEVPHSRQ